MLKTLVVGNPNRISELKKALPENWAIDQQQDYGQVVNIHKYTCIIDTNADDHPDAFTQNLDGSKATVIASATKCSLAEMTKAMSNPPVIIGMNCLPTFINRSVKEWSLNSPDDQEAALNLAEKLKWETQIVDDRVGMVTPRIIFMIVNEACYTVQEGTANMVDIDSSMKLGTAYPKGPFAWADEIGVQDVYETLLALWQDTGDERYKISPLLKKHYLKNQAFIN